MGSQPSPDAADRVVDTIVLGMWQANCHILADLSEGTAVVVDPGQDGAEPVRRRLAERGVRCEAILLTHGHLDHVWSAPQLADELDVPVLLHPDDRWLWDDPAAAFGAQLPAGVLERELGLRWEPSDEPLEPLADGQRLQLAGFPVQVRHTPGHTPGSCVFLLPGLADPAAPATLVSGDLLFAGSVGRTDFPRGSWDELQRSLREQVLPLQDDTLVLTGHGPSTTVGRERAANPFLAPGA